MPIYLRFLILAGKLPTTIIKTSILLCVSILEYGVHQIQGIRNIRIHVALPHIHVPKINVTKFFKIHPPRIHISLPHISIPQIHISLPPIHIPHPHIQLPRVRTIFIVLPFLFMFICATFGGFSYVFILKDLPNPSDLITRKPIVSTKIYDRNNVLLYTIYKEENRTPIPLSDVPEYAKQATIAIEDKDFYAHKGFSFRGIIRAVRSNLEKGSTHGGSTITQQLVKNTLLTPEKTMRRKLREIILAIRIEMTYSKDTILEMYLNEVPYGGSLYGIEEASEAYFGKPAKNLTLAESAMLAGLPQAPSVYSPFGSHPEYAYARQHEVLTRMVEDGHITAQQAEAAKEEQLVFLPNKTPIKAPHFVMYVREFLAAMFGENMVSQGGLEVHTTLDSELQTFTEESIKKELDRLTSMKVTNAASIVTNPKNGEILAMVGSKDYFDIQHDGQVNVTLMPRQPGSSIKALTYAVALENGYTPSTIIDDSPITYKTPGSEPYSPQNYDGKFHGKVTVRTALASSYNVPAVKTLSTVGIHNVIEKGRQMGLTTWDEQSAKRFGLSLTLGGGEVRMVDMAKLYGTFANAGITVDLNPILSVKNYKGDTLYINPCQQAKSPCNGIQTINPEVAYQITDILSDNTARSAAFGLHSVLTIPNQQVAVKTGTTNSLRDNWTIGYTTDKLVATWVGNNDNTPMSYVASGITGASPIWRSVMDGLLDKESPHIFSQNPNVKKIRICATTGTLPCAACPVIKDEYFIPGTEPTTSCLNEYFSHAQEEERVSL